MEPPPELICEHRNNERERPKIKTKKKKKPNSCKATNEEEKKREEKHIGRAENPKVTAHIVEMHATDINCCCCVLSKGRCSTSLAKMALSDMVSISSVRVLERSRALSRGATLSSPNFQNRAPMRYPV